MINNPKTKEIKEFLINTEFVSIGTSDARGKPCVTPKLLIAFKDDFIYLADYVIGRTFQNLKVNPKISISAVDVNKLIHYQINGTAVIMNKGLEYDRIIGELKKKEISFTVERIINGVRREKKHHYFEAAFPELFVVIKMKIKEVIKMTPNVPMEIKTLEDVV